MKTPEYALSSLMSRLNFAKHDTGDSDHPATGLSLKYID